jgi:hypothetical protein
MSDDGRTIAVSGVCTDWTTGLHFYRVKVFEEVDNVSWSQKGASIDSEKTSTYLDDHARADVSLSGDGLNVAVSTVYIKDRDSSLAADTTPEGSVFVYNFNSSNTWDLASTFSGDDTDGGIPGEYVGLKVSLDGTGSKVAIGVQYHDGAGGTGDSGGGNQDSGQVLVCTVGDATSCQVIATGAAPGDRVGSSVMISSGSSSSCVVFGSVGSDSNGADSGSASVFCEKDTNGTITWVNRGVQLVGEAAGDEFGFSVAISSDSNFIAVGSRLNDPSDDKKDAGHVRVFQLEPSSLNYVKVGNDIDGERGERSDKDTGKYYVGDYSGYSIALSDKREDNKLRLVVGAPNNAGDGPDGYYNGHVRLYECDLTSTAVPFSWVQVLDDIEGGTRQEVAGRSVAASQDGTRLIFGSPKFESFGGGYYTGAVFVYEQTEYSSQPSDLPTTPPSQVPSTSVKPSLVPSSSPRPTHTVAPSSNPSSVHDRVFQIRTTYGEFGSNVDSEEWCLTASSTVYGSSAGGSKLRVRRCNPSNKLQLWSTDAYNQLQLAAFPNNPSCITTRSKSIFIDACARIDDSDSSTQDPAKSFTFVDDESGQWIKQTKSIRGDEAPTSSVADLYIGINPEQRFARVNLYRKHVTNGSLNKWKVVYGFANNVPLSWSLLGSDIDGEAAGDTSGHSVSLSSDGKTVAIGAHHNAGNGNRSGHVRVLQWNAITLDWAQMGNDIDGEAAGDTSGYSVSLSSDGKTVAIGSRTTNQGNGWYSGHTRVFGLNASTQAWIQIGDDIDAEAAGDTSGTAVSLSSDGKTVAIGARYNDGNAGGDSGHTRVFQWNAGDASTIGAWAQMGVEDIDGEAAGDRSGYAVSLSSDGKTVAIGALLNDGNSGQNSGQTRVLQWNAITLDWVQMGIDIDGEAAGDWSGHSVSLSSDGMTVAIGAFRNDGNGTDSGRVRVYSMNAIA